MKKYLFATTAVTAMTLSGFAVAQERSVSVSGEGRLGLVYDGGAADSDDELRAVSRLRITFTGTATTPTGLTFGGSIRAGNAANADGFGPFEGSSRMTAGNVFVSGAFGRLTFGDTDGADRQRVGDLLDFGVGNVTTIGLTDQDFLNETPHLTNARNPLGLRSDVGTIGQRPTVRYDYDFAGFGLSVSSDNRLQDIAVGLGFGTDFGGGSFEVGVGYANLAAEAAPLNVDGSRLDQFSASIGAVFGDFGAKVTYSNLDADETIETLGLGVKGQFGDIGIQAYVHSVISGGDNLENDTAFGFGGTYELGGGARLRGGIVQHFDDETRADFGIQMAF